MNTVNTRAAGGFTILEVLVAVMILGVGIIALASTSGVATRQIGRGRMATIASQRATERLDKLRRAAAIRNAAKQRCQHPDFASGSETKFDVTEVWTVSNAAVGLPRTVSDSVTYRRAGGIAGFKLTTIIECK